MNPVTMHNLPFTHNSPSLLLLLPLTEVVHNNALNEYPVN